MSETQSSPDLDRDWDKRSERILEELLRSVDELESRERQMYLPLNMIPDPKVRSAVIMLARKYADMTENFAQSLARRAESYGVMMVTANLEKPTEDGIILVVKFQVLGVRGDVLRARYQALRQVVRNIKGYKSVMREQRTGEIDESEPEPGPGSADTGRYSASRSEENPSKSNSEEYNGAGSGTHGDSEASGGILGLEG